MPTVLITPEALIEKDGLHAAMLREAGFEILFPRDREFTRGHADDAATIEEVKVADALIAGGEYLRAPALQELNQLRVIARVGVGYDRIDVDAATRHGIAVTITPTANHQAVSEHALALLFALSKRVVEDDRRTRSGEWPRDLIEPIRGKTMGLLGLGRIGRSMAPRCLALGMHVMATDPYSDAEYAAQHGIRLVDFDELIAESDVLSIHCPCNEATVGLINEQVLRSMKKSAYLINTARGPIVNETALAAALKRGDIRGAGIDVLEHEPPAKDNPLFELENVVITPHTAGLDRIAHRDMAIEAADCIVKLYRGEWPSEAVVNGTLAANWSWPA